jgi:hypothetical protein
MSAEGDQSQVQKPTDEKCRDGNEHDWRKVSVGDNYSYYFCQMCGSEKGRPQHPPNQCPP